MAIIDLFSKRKKQEERASQGDVYVYDQIPEKLRVQIIHLLRDAIGDPRNNEESYRWWQYIHNTLAREIGRFELSNKSVYDDKCFAWFMTAHYENALDFIELAFRFVDKIVSETLRNGFSPSYYGIKELPHQVIQELNQRFKENDVGYEFEEGCLVRVDNRYIHSVLVKPVINLLAEKRFEKANDDFMLAHQHYREGRQKDAVVAAQRAFESILKAICVIKKWSYQDGDRASELLKLVKANGLFPNYLGNGFDSYIAMMKTGLPEVRNNAGGHGASPAAPQVPSYIAAYALHLTAANIILLVDALKQTEGATT